MQLTELEKNVIKAIKLAIACEDIYCVHVDGITDYCNYDLDLDLTVNQVKGVVGSLVKKRKIYEVEINHFDVFEGV